MPVRPPHPGESQRAYLSYCIPLEIDSGRPQRQAAAICYSLYRRKKELSDMGTKEITILLEDEDYEEGEKAWTAAQVNDLPDSAFLFVESGGDKDDQGKTVPRSLRHLPFRNQSGEVDLDHLRNALARLGQMDTGETGGERWLTRALRDRLTAKARRILQQAQKAATKAADDLDGLDDTELDQKAVEWEVEDWTEEWKEWAVTG